MSWFTRLRNVFRSDKVSDEIDREMAFHLAERTDDLVAAGMDPVAARREARRRFGNYALQKEDTRDRDLLTWLDTFLADVRYAFRGFRAAPGFALVAILSLALGIGANTAIFTLINVVMLKSLPVSRPDELVKLTLNAGPGSKGDFCCSRALWEQIRDHLGAALAGVFVYGSTGGADLSAGGESRPVSVGLVGGDMFSTLGVRPVVGRTLVAADDYRGCPPVAVITHAFWQSEFAGRADVVGTSVALNGQPYQIVGVTERPFFGIEFGYSVPIWTPQCAEGFMRGAGGGGTAGGGSVVGRLKPGVTPEQARARLAALTPGVLEGTLPPNASAEIAAQYRISTFGVVPYAKGDPFLRERSGEALFMLMAIVGVVLLVACANVANLLLARATARQREIAVRLALGASRARVIRHLLTESVLLSLIGASLGVLFALWGSRVLVGFLSQTISLDLAPDVTVLAFTIAVAVLTGVLFGLAPAWRAVRADPHAMTKPNGRSVAEGQSRFGVGKALVVAQIALSLVMVAAAGLLVGSWGRLVTVDPGFRPGGVLLTGVNTRPARLPANQRGETYSRILERLRAMPGVAAASAVWRTPFGSANARLVIEVDGFTPTSASDANVQPNQVSDGYFATIGIRILAGRDFNSGDVATSQTVAIVNEELARKFFGGAGPAPSGVEGAIGRHFRTRSGMMFDSPVEIIGIVANSKEFDLREESKSIAYFALSQIVPPGPNFSFALRTEGSPSALVPGVKAAIAEIDSRFSLNLATLKHNVDESTRVPRTLALLSGFFGGLALLLAMIGLYGIMSYTVARRRNEIGVRIALGAARTRVIRMVLGDVGRIVLAGVAVGMVLTLAVTRLIKTFLFGVEPNDPATLALSALTLGAVAIGAALLPALRAARLDPVAALRED